MQLIRPTCTKFTLFMEFGALTNIFKKGRGVQNTPKQQGLATLWSVLTIDKGSRGSTLHYCTCNNNYTSYNDKLCINESE